MFLRFKKNKFCFDSQAGFVALLSTLVVLAMMLVVVGVIGLLTINQQKIASNLIKSTQAYYAADAGAQDSLYRIIKGKDYQASNSLAVAYGTALINITDAGVEKVVYINGEADNRFRSLRIRLSIDTENISFFYGVQVGDGGLVMSNNSGVIGSVYSNGSVQGGNGAVISGDVFVASTATNSDQQSEIVNSDFIFGQASPAIDAAQSFTPSISDRLNKISLYLKKTGVPGNKTVRILTDNGGSPSKNLVAPGAYGTLNDGQVSQSNYGWIDITFNTPPNLIAGVKYWIVIDSSINSSNYFYWGNDAGDTYAGGTGKYSYNWNAASPSWLAVNGDLAFRAYLGGTINSLNTLAVGGHAHANTINSCSITGDAYYQTIINSSVGGNYYPNSPDPAMENMPVSQSNIDDWKSDATAGGVINGNYILTNGAISSLGPRKIIGNLEVSNNADLTITGTIYVTGAINIFNGAKLRLGSNYGLTSGIILTDGLIDVSNNAIFYGNGIGTYLMFLSTKSGAAINVANNANTVIFYASEGTVSINNNAILKEVTAYQISLLNGAQVVYESGLASAKFSSGAGAGWAIESWEEAL
ncbi:MAG: hypothetical protein UU87_C0001G0069 [Parcubacteria group bacterium GW2011_GWA2_42_11]|nr:MAG: hypothetical protein UU87_C0001G0069 [Parcubacteria group bacterium GW2011_GWA2_42_11]